jgi:hypothetical protein
MLASVQLCQRLECALNLQQLGSHLLPALVQPNEDVAELVPLAA